MRIRAGRVASRVLTVLLTLAAGAVLHNVYIKRTQHTNEGIAHREREK